MQSELETERNARQKAEGELFALKEKLTDINQWLKPGNLFLELKGKHEKPRATVKEVEIIVDLVKQKLL